jgi:hypothetical protein
MQIRFSLWSENKIEVHAYASCYSPRPVDFLPSPPHALSNHTMYTPVGPQRSALNTSPPAESVHRSTSTPGYSQSSFRSPSNVIMDRPASSTSQVSEHLPPFDPYYRQYQGPGSNMGTHRYAPPHPTNIDPAYTWQGDATRTGYRALYSPQGRPGWSGGSVADQEMESFNASTAAQIMAEIKGLAARVTSLCEREAERAERTNQMITCMEKIETQISGLESALAEGIETRVRRSSGSRSVTNEHPMLKVCHDTTSSMSSVLTTSACGAHNFFSDVWSRGVWEQRETYQGFV